MTALELIKQRIQNLRSSLENLLSGNTDRSLLSPIPKSTPSPTPTPTITPTPTPFPLHPDIVKKYGQDYPYKEDIKQKWPGIDPNKVANIVYGESSFDPKRYHINKPVWASGTMPQTREQWLDLRRKYPSIDVGLTQLNTADAMNNYLSSKGLTYYDLFNNPQMALEVAYDLYSGKIPYTAKGWGNWNAAKRWQEELGYDYGISQ